jgi:hypothetical protein
MKYKELRKQLIDTKIDYYTKIDLIKTEVETEILQRWSVKCAKSVLHIYEKEYPNDTRARDCINATTQYLDGDIGLDELVSKREATFSAVYSAANSATYSAANSANSAVYSANSAANSANSAVYSANSAAYSAALSANSDTYSAIYSANSAVYSANSAAYSAARSANSATYSAIYSANSAAHSDDKKKQQELNIKLLLDCLVKELPDTKLGRKLYPNAEITGDKLVIKL